MILRARGAVRFEIVSIAPDSVAKSTASLGKNQGSSELPERCRVDDHVLVDLDHVDPELAEMAQLARRSPGARPSRFFFPTPACERERVETAERRRHCRRRLDDTGGV